MKSTFIKVDFYFYRMFAQNAILIVAVVIAAIIAVAKGKLTTMGGLAGVVIALGIYAGADVWGLLMLGLFFVLGTVSTSLGKSIKQAANADDSNENGRTAGQVLANGGMAAVCGILAWMLPQHSELLVVMLAAILSSATADTLSSELGTVYGRRFYNILTFRKDTRGENGVVSLEGTLLGLVGSVLIAVVYSLAYDWRLFLLIIIAGTLGNLADSILGATLERKGIINNNAVNLLNTLVAALTALCCFLI